MSITRRIRFSPAALLLAFVLIGLVPGGARADGDPASDVLVSAPPLFITQASGASYAGERALVAQLRAASARGRPLRVAVIAARSDLGSIAALWQHPQAYAQFLGKELSLGYDGELLVVMPDGFGVARGGHGVRTSLAGLAPRSGRLVTAASQAIQRLTGAAPADATATTHAARGFSRVGGTSWWVGTALALALLATGWTLSLRRRPLGGPGLGRIAHRR